MENLRAQPVEEGETPVSSINVVSKSLSKTSSQLFLKSLGIKQVGSSKSSSTNERETREELTAQARAAVQSEIDILRQRCEKAEERQATTSRELEEYKLLTEKNAKAQEDTNQLVRALMVIQSTLSTSK
jgi:preprotein translocase subunit SecD